MYISRARFRDVDLELGRQGWTVITGPNGSGKTELLHTLARLEDVLIDSAQLHTFTGGQAGSTDLHLPQAGREWFHLLHDPQTTVESPLAQAFLDDGLPQGPSAGPRSLAALINNLVHGLHEAFGARAFAPRRPVAFAPGVVLVDDIEAHLHVTWQQRIGFWLKEHFPYVQFVVTTHSPYACQAADRLVSLAGELPFVADEALHQRVIYGSAEDTVLSELFGLDRPYSLRAQRLRSELAELEIAVLGGEADDTQLTRYAELLELLASSPTARATEIAALQERIHKR